MGHLLSVLMPVFNAEKYLAQSIESILSQSFKEYELIIVDDCSYDESLEIIKKYAKFDSRISFYQNHKNLGIAGNRNMCFNYSVGEYIAWQDADDISLENRLQLQFDFLNANSNVGIIGGAMELFERNQIIGYRHYPLEDASIRRNIYKYSTIAQPTMMIRRSALLEAGPYNLTYPPAEDLDMTFRIGRTWRLANTKETLIKYRVNEGSATFKAMKVMEINSAVIRQNNMNSLAFRATLGDRLFCLLHRISIYIIPSRFKYILFSAWRNRDK